MPSAGFELAIVAIKLPQNNASYRTASESVYLCSQFRNWIAGSRRTGRTYFRLRQRRLRSASRKGTPS